MLSGEKNSWYLPANKRKCHFSNDKEIAVQLGREEERGGDSGHGDNNFKPSGLSDSNDRYYVFMNRQLKGSEEEERRW